LHGCPVAVEARLRTHVHLEDFVGRVGGDEFVVVLAGPADASTAVAVAVATRLQQVMNEPRALRSVSIGIATAHPGECVVSQWLRQADQAALSAKTNGDDGICVFTEEMRAQNAVCNDVELHLRTATQDGSLVMHYQPEVDLRTGQMIGAEALVRWNHPTLGWLQPDSFIDVAESTNFAGELGRWVLHEACRQLASLLSEIPGLTFHLSVNVSPTQLAADDFVETVAEVLTEHGIVGADLTLEITERARAISSALPFPPSRRAGSSRMETSALQTPPTTNHRATKPDVRWPPSQPSPRSEAWTCSWAIQGCARRG